MVAKGIVCYIPVNVMIAFFLPYSMVNPVWWCYVDVYVRGGTDAGHEQTLTSFFLLFAHTNI